MHDIIGMLCSRSRTVMRDPRTNREDMETVVLVYRDKAFKETFQNQPVIKPTDNIYVGMVVQVCFTMNV